MLGTLLAFIALTASTLWANGDAIQAAAQVTLPTSVTNPSQVFEIVSIRPTDPKRVGFAIRPKLSNFTVTGASLKFLIQYAFDVHDFQIVGIPGSMSSARFDIVAKADIPSPDGTAAPAEPTDANAREELLQARIRAMLADRFKLRVHRVSKEMQVYALTVAKGGPKLHLSTENTGYTPYRGQYVCSHTSMEELASMLSEDLNRVVLNQTKLTEGYGFTLKWSPDETESRDPAVPGILTALEEQLGLKLISTKGPVDTVLVDYAEMPSEN